MNDLQSELSAFYRDCEQRLAVCEAATAGEWHPSCCIPEATCNCGYIFAKEGEIAVAKCYHGQDSDGAGYSDELLTPEQMKHNMRAIAASRNQRPGELRALVKLAKALEATINEHIAATIELRMIVGDYEAPPNKLEAALREILSDWRAGQ